MRHFKIYWKDDEGESLLEEVSFDSIEYLKNYIKNVIEFDGFEFESVKECIYREIDLEDDIDDPCPECGKQLRMSNSGGVKCSCGYWFCY